MQPDIAAERQGFADKAAPPLAERVVEALDVIGFTTLFINRPMALRWTYLGIGIPVISVDDRPPTVIRWQSLPQALARLGGTITNRNADDLARSLIECQPDPDDLCLGADE